MKISLATHRCTHLSRYLHRLDSKRALPMVSPLRQVRPVASRHTLAKRQVFTLPRECDATSLTVASGCIWLTEPTSARDVVLTPGCTHEFAPGYRSLVLEALQDSEILLNSRKGISGNPT